MSERKCVFLKEGCGGGAEEKGGECCLILRTFLLLPYWTSVCTSFSHTGAQKIRRQKKKNNEKYLCECPGTPDVSSQQYTRRLCLCNVPTPPREMTLSATGWKCKQSSLVFDVGKCNILDRFWSILCSSMLKIDSRIQAINEINLLPAALVSERHRKFFCGGMFSHYFIMMAHLWEDKLNWQVLFNLMEDCVHRTCLEMCLIGFHQTKMYIKVMSGTLNIAKTVLYILWCLCRVWFSC